nr:unnamed protein product [Digitaria exilis]
MGSDVTPTATPPLGVGRRYVRATRRREEAKRRRDTGSPPAISQRGAVASRGAAGCGWSPCVLPWAHELSRRGRNTHVVWGSAISARDHELSGRTTQRATRLSERGPRL